MIVIKPLSPAKRELLPKGRWGKTDGKKDENNCGELGDVDAR